MYWKFYSKIGQLADINVYLRSHYLILDPRLTDKVEVKEDNEYVTERMDGKTELYCQTGHTLPYNWKVG